MPNSRLVFLTCVSCADGKHSLLGLAPRISSARTFQCVCLLPWSGHETLVPVSGAPFLEHLDSYWALGVRLVPAAVPARRRRRWAGRLNISKRKIA